MRPSKITEFGLALKAKMDLEGWTAPRLAAALDVSRAMVYEYLRGAKPGLDVRIAAQIKLGINLTGAGSQLFLPDFLKTQKTSPPPEKTSPPPEWSNTCITHSQSCSYGK